MRFQQHVLINRCADVEHHRIKKANLTSSYSTSFLYIWNKTEILTIDPNLVKFYRFKCANFTFMLVGSSGCQKSVKLFTQPWSFCYTPQSAPK